ncbi:MAG: hypothetical protein Q8Q67_03620 [bacterium]|nr:hypothetical protein [bacterium]
MKEASKKGAAQTAADQLTQSHGNSHIAWTKPVLKSKVPEQANRLVVYYPETITLNKDENIWTIDALFMDGNSDKVTDPQVIALNDLVLAKSQRKELKNYDKYQAAMATYDRVINLAGSSNYALTTQSSIANDDFVASVYEPNQLVRFLLETLTHETDEGSIDFYEISVIYVDLGNKVHAISLDKLILSDEQIKKIRNINYQAYRWYKHQHKLCTKNVCTREY